MTVKNINVHVVGILLTSESIQLVHAEGCGFDFHQGIKKMQVLSL